MIARATKQLEGVDADSKVETRVTVDNGRLVKRELREETLLRSFLVAALSVEAQSPLNTAEKRHSALEKAEEYYESLKGSMLRERSKVLDDAISDARESVEKMWLSFLVLTEPV